jgi:hypothetical protein
MERRTVRLKRLHRAAVFEFIRWNGSGDPEPKFLSIRREPRYRLKLARHYQALLDSGKFESRVALARFLGVSRARVTEVLRRLGTNGIKC